MAARPTESGKYHQDEFQKMSDEIPLELTLQIGRYVLTLPCTPETC